MSQKPNSAHTRLRMMQLHSKKKQELVNNLKPVMEEKKQGPRVFAGTTELEILRASLEEKPRTIFDDLRDLFRPVNRVVSVVVNFVVDVFSFLFQKRIS